MKADIKVVYWYPIVFSIPLVTLFTRFDALDGVIVAAVVFMDAYFFLGLFRRKDALVIEGTEMIVKSPFKTRRYDIAKLRELHIQDPESPRIKAVYEETEITLLGDIYTSNVTEIYDYLQANYPNTTKKDES